MSKSREPVYGKGHLHLITCTCYQKQLKLEQEKHRNVFARILEEVRVKFYFKVAGYVVMPDHFRLLMVEPAVDTAANSIEVLQQRYQRRYNASARSTDPVWEHHYSDLHVFGAGKIAAQLEAMHQEPVKAALAESATDWEWSSARFYAGMPDGIVTVERATER
ncbi:MAG: transposase [Silvibacterium sp.]